MRESHAARLHIADRSQAQTIELAETIAQTLAHAYRVWAGNFFVSVLPGQRLGANRSSSPVFGFRSNFPPTGSGVPAEMPGGRQCRTIQQRALAQILNVNRMVRSECIQIRPRRKSPLGELRRHPATADYDPAPARLCLHRRADLSQSVGERTRHFPMELGVPTQTGDSRMDMRIDQSWYHRPASQVDDPRPRTHQRAHIAVACRRR